MLYAPCKACGLTMHGTRYRTNPEKVMWLHPGLKACAKVKPINPTKGHPDDVSN